MNTPSASVYTDFQGLSGLKAKARKDSDASLDEVARQFESLFMQMMVKSMRQASLGEGALESDQSLFYRDMYDQQLALHLANSGGLGLAEVIKRQLGGSQGADAAAKALSLDDYRQRPVAPVIPLNKSAPAVVPLEAKAVEVTFDSPDQFVRELWPLAKEAAAELGLPPGALMAQAALETGWGRYLIRHPDGSHSHNLFNIKADHRWDGERVHVNSLEFEDGIPVKKKASFRSYESFADSFSDYVDFLRANPRYRKALESTGDSRAYFAELQKAGYATDPEYAAKISSVMGGKEMRQAVGQLKMVGGTPL